jgi:membrane-associated phospholipid phosphatase
MRCGNLGQLASFPPHCDRVTARQAVGPGSSQTQRVGAPCGSLPGPSAPTSRDGALLQIVPRPRPRVQPDALCPTIVTAGAIYAVALAASALLDVRADILNDAPLYIGPAAFLCLYGRTAFPRAVRTMRLLEATCIVIALGLSLACLSYVGAMADLPLRDGDMMWIDRHLGFDWLQMMQALDRRPLVLDVLDGAYATFTSQLIGAVLALIIAGRTRELDRFFLTFVCASVLAEVASVFIPTVGPMSTVAANVDFAHLPTLGRTTADIVVKLRDGTLRAIDFAAIDGIISFPSLHAAVCVIVPFSLRWNRPLFCLTAALDTVMLVSAVPSGNHYLVDVIGGMCVAVLAIVCSGPMQASLERLVRHSPREAHSGATDGHAVAVRSGLQNLTD